MPPALSGTYPKYEKRGPACPERESESMAAVQSTSLYAVGTPLSVPVKTGPRRTRLPRPAPPLAAACTGTGAHLLPCLGERSRRFEDAQWSGPPRLGSDRFQSRLRDSRRLAATRVEPGTDGKGVMPYVRVCTIRHSGANDLPRIEHLHNNERLACSHTDPKGRARPVHPV